jgi:hypothetical protein
MSIQAQTAAAVGSGTTGERPDRAAQVEAA